MNNLQRKNFRLINCMLAVFDFVMAAVALQCLWLVGALVVRASSSKICFQTFAPSLPLQHKNFLLADWLKYVLDCKLLCTSVVSASAYGTGGFCICLCVYRYTYMCLCMHVCVCVYVCICAYLCICVSVCNCFHIHMYICIYIQCVCKFLVICAFAFKQ